MVCQACHRVTIRSLLCDSCRRGLTRAAPRLLSGGLLVRAGFEHTGPARSLVHDLKYRGVGSYARLVGRLLGPELPALPLVPVPRPWTRRLRYGVDPATVIADELARHTGGPVLHALGRPIHQRRRAGRGHASSVEYRCLVPFSYSELIVVDDVVTTGTTVLAATAALGQSVVRLAVAANLVVDGTAVTDATHKV